MTRGRRTGRNQDKAYKGHNGATEDRLREVRLLQKTPAGQAGRLAAPSPESLRQFIAAETCPWCGRGPYKSLAIHTNSAHGVSADELREMAGFVKTQPLCSADLSERYREMGKGKRLPESAYDPEKHKKRSFSKAGLEVQRQKLDKARSPEQRRRAGEAIAKKTLAEYADKHEQVVSLFRSGKQIKEIRDELGVSIPLIRGALKRAGVTGDLRRRRWQIMPQEDRSRATDYLRKAYSETKKREFAELVEQFQSRGATYQAALDIAQERGMTARATIDRLRKAGIHVPDGRSRGDQS